MTVSSDSPADGPTESDVVLAIGRRDRELADRLQGLDGEQLLATSSLPGWSVLTIACHLRYGAEANLAVTEDMLIGRPTAYYPLGRAEQRDATLAPRHGEAPADVVASLVEHSDALQRRWRGLASQDWDRRLIEPANNVDLGPVTLRTLAVLRLTEVDVHGTDLALGLGEWSDEFIAAALPMRLHWLPKRRSNHRSDGEKLDGIWRITAADGPSVIVRLSDDEVTVADSHDTPAGAATIEGSGRDLLAFLLGRTDGSGLRFGGDEDLAARFTSAFPPP